MKYPSYVSLFLYSKVAKIVNEDSEEFKEGDWQISAGKVL